MHPEICKFVSDDLRRSVKNFGKDNFEVRLSPKEINEGRALTFVNIPAKYGTETPGVSKSRRVEVEAVSREVKKILGIDRNATIGVITLCCTGNKK